MNPIRRVMNIVLFLPLVLSAAGACTRTKVGSSESRALAHPQEIEAQKKKLIEIRDDLILWLNKAIADFERTGKNEFVFIPTLENCRLGAKFRIEIKRDPSSSRRTIEAFFANGPVTRRLSFDLTVGGTKPLSIYYKISNLSFDHEIPVLTQTGFATGFREVEIKRIYKDFSTFYRGKTPTEYTQLNETTDSQSGYLNWLYALGHLNDYLVALMDYQKLGGSI